MATGNGSLNDSRPVNRMQRGLEERPGFWGNLLDMPLLWAVLAAVGCSLLLMPRIGSYVPEWDPGDVATTDVSVPFDLTLPDETATEAVREEARAAVLPVYDFEPRLQVELVEAVAELFTACRSGLVGEELLAATDLRTVTPML